MIELQTKNESKELQNDIKLMAEKIKVQIIGDSQRNTEVGKSYRDRKRYRDSNRERYTEVEIVTEIERDTEVERDTETKSD